MLLMLLYFLLRAWSKSASGAFRVIGLQVPPLGPAIRRSIVPLLLAIVVLPAYMIARAGMLQYMDIAPVQQPIVTRLKTLHGEGQVAHLCVLVFLAVAVAPAVEGIVLRGMLCLPLRSRVGPVPAAAVVSAVFAALHWGSAALVENLAVMGYLIILALILTALMEAARTMLAPILAHAAHNAVMIGLILLAKTEKAWRLYGLNLLGSGLGAVLGIGLMYGQSPTQALMQMSLLGFAASLAAAAKKTRVVVTFLVGVATVSTFTLWRPLAVPISEYKLLFYYREQKDYEPLAERYGPLGTGIQ